MSRTHIGNSLFVATLSRLVAMPASRFDLMWHKYHHLCVVLKPLVLKLFGTGMTLNKSILVVEYSVDSNIP